jgi:hypothetical protein
VVGGLAAQGAQEGVVLEGGEHGAIVGATRCSLPDGSRMPCRLVRSKLHGLVAKLAVFPAGFIAQRRERGSQSQ